FWTVCTRPLRANGMGLTVDATHRLLEITENGFLRLEDTDLVYRRWRELVIGYSISGRQVHDAHLVASMLVHDVTHILTFNGRDFVQYAEIEVIDPLTMA
ncbi:MAG: PIN domain nuclease, partial [Bryobacteraceae bacterium]